VTPQLEPVPRAILKRAAERLLLAPARLSRVLHRGRTIVLAYHNIVPDGESIAGDRSLHLPQRAFARQLDLLTRTHDVVPLSALFETGSRPRRPRAVITFDDAYAGAMSAGILELARRRLPATVFVAPALLEGQRFWWDRLAGPETGVVPAPVRDRVLQDMAGDSALVFASEMKAGTPLAQLPGHAAGATLESLTRAAAQPGITIGSHSWSHPNLCRLPLPRLTEELTRPLQWLRERLPIALPWLAYPYGLVSETVARAAADAGYSGAFLVDGGWLPRRPRDMNVFMLPRFNVSAGLSHDGFRLRIAGLFAA
jgi:peptidoglycan/xylan/chitin deacetylase (PgdA/CDA1 family)